MKSPGKNRMQSFCLTDGVLSQPAGPSPLVLQPDLSVLDGAQPCCQSENQGNGVCDALELLWLNFPATALPSSIHGELYLSLGECLAPDAESDPSPCTSEQVKKMTMCFSLSLCLSHPHTGTHTCRGTSPPSLHPRIVAGRIKKTCRSLSQSKGIKLKWLGLVKRRSSQLFPSPFLQVILKPHLLSTLTLLDLLLAEHFSLHCVSSTLHPGTSTCLSSILDHTISQHDVSTDISQGSRKREVTCPPEGQ